MLAFYIYTLLEFIITNQFLYIAYLPRYYLQYVHVAYHRFKITCYITLLTVSKLLVIHWELSKKSVIVDIQWLNIDCRCKWLSKSISNYYITPRSWIGDRKINTGHFTSKISKYITARVMPYLLQFKSDQSSTFTVVTHVIPCIIVPYLRSLVKEAPSNTRPVYSELDSMY